MYSCFSAYYCFPGDGWFQYNRIDGMPKTQCVDDTALGSVK